MIDESQRERADHLSVSQPTPSLSRVENTRLVSTLARKEPVPRGHRAWLDLKAAR